MNASVRCPFKRVLFTSLVFALCARGGYADDSALFSFSGFGTLGVVHSSEADADFTSSIYKPDGAGHSHNWSVDVDSVVAAQLTATLSPQLSAVVQVVSEQNEIDSYRPSVVWANVKYQFTPELNVRIGRTTLQIFMLTDTRRIGYANPWVRPPVEVYGLAPLTQNDGVDVSYRVSVGAATNTFRLTMGRSDARYPDLGSAGTSKTRQLFVFVDTFEQGFGTLHFNYGRARLTVPSLGTLFDGFRQFGPEGVAIADKYDVDDCLFRFFTLGANYDPGRWFLTGEWGRIDRGSLLGESAAWYVSSGYRIGKFTPYLTYANVDADHNTSDPGLTLASLQPPLVEPAVELNAALNTILGTKTVQDTISIGGRWDVARNVALKLQFDHSNLGSGSAGVLINPQPGFEPGGTVNVVSATIDFVL